MRVRFCAPRRGRTDDRARRLGTRTGTGFSDPRGHSVPGPSRSGGSPAIPWGIWRPIYGPDRHLFRGGGVHAGRRRHALVGNHDVLGCSHRRAANIRRVRLFRRFRMEELGLRTGRTRSPHDPDGTDTSNATGHPCAVFGERRLTQRVRRRRRGGQDTARHVATGEHLPAGASDLHRSAPSAARPHVSLLRPPRVLIGTAEVGARPHRLSPRHVGYSDTSALGCRVCMRGCVWS